MKAILNGSNKYVYTTHRSHFARHPGNMASRVKDGSKKSGMCNSGYNGSYWAWPRPVPCDTIPPPIIGETSPASILVGFLTPSSPADWQNNARLTKPQCGDNAAIFDLDHRRFALHSVRRDFSGVRNSTADTNRHGRRPCAGHDRLQRPGG